VTDTKGGAPTFESAIKPLFRDSDRAAMLAVFDLFRRWVDSDTPPEGRKTVTQAG